MNQMDELVARYLETWNETHPAVRRKMIDDLWSPAGVYTDPIAVAAGRDAIDATIAAVQSQFGGLTFTLAGPVDAHHNIVRFRWHLGAADSEADAEPLVVGFDVAVLDDDGRLTGVYGFLDKIPA